MATITTLEGFGSKRPAGRLKGDLPPVLDEILRDGQGGSAPASSPTNSVQVSAAEAKGASLFLPLALLGAAYLFLKG